MDALKSPLARTGLVVLLTGIALVVVKDRLRAAELAAWDRLGQARASGFDTPTLEEARLALEGTVAEPWISFHLAVQLYASGTDLDRARAIAVGSLEQHPSHAMAPALSRLVEALDSFTSSAPDP